MSDTPQTFIINNNDKVNNNIAISTNLYSAILPMFNRNISYTYPQSGEILINGYNKTLANGGYIKLPYVSPAGAVEPNGTFVNGKTIKYYKTDGISIYKASHIVQDNSYDAEMVVELVPTTNPGDKLYLCFLLKCYRDNSKPLNDIDKLIINSTKLNTSYKHDKFNLQNLIDINQKKIMYKNNLDTIIIFTKPINIKEYDFSQYNTITPDLFPLYPNDNYDIINPPTKEGFEITEKNIKEGMTNPPAGKTAVLTCTPINTGTKKENDQELVMMNNSKDTGQYILMGLVVTLIVTFVGIFAFPTVYFALMSSDNVNPGERIIYTCIILFMLIILSLTLIFKGITPPGIGSFIISGFTIGMLTVMSILGVIMRKDDLSQVINFTNLKISDGLNAFMSKISAMGPYLVVALVLLVIVIVIIAEVGIKGVKKKEKKTRFKPLRNKSPIYIKTLYDIVMGVGLSFGSVFVILIGCFITPAKIPASE
jgi:hypothetical protein